MEPWQPGSRFGQLEIVRELGRGAFGRVYLATDTLVGRPVALKVLVHAHADADPRTADLVRREIRAAGRLRSPHVVTLYRAHPPDARNPWMLEMEYVEGGSLAAILDREGSLAVERAIRIARQIALALAAAHDSGIVHGDVKPGNVLVTPAGDAKLTDFGLARLAGDRSLSLGSGEQPAGTPSYMAPEVLLGEQPTAASDIWGYGVLLHRMLSGRAPFDGHDLNSLFYAIHHRDPPPLPAGVAPGLAHLVLHCLAKDPVERPPSWLEILEALEPKRPAAIPAPTPRPRALVGRAREMACLSEALHDLERGQGTALLLSGPTGIGKSALLVEMHALAAARGIRWLEAACTPLGGLLRPLLESARAVTGAVEPAAARRFGSAAEVVGRLLEDPVPTLENRAQALWAIERLLSGLAEERRLAVVLEDVHHADAEDAKLLLRLADFARAAGVLFVAAASADDAGPNSALASLAAASQVAHLPVGSLSATETHGLVERWAGTRVQAEVTQRVVAASQGNPLFALELLRHLERTGALLRTGGQVAPGPAWASAALPERVHELVKRRVADLSEEERSILDVAAVDGATFEGEAVAAVLEQPLIVVLRRLQRICRGQGLIQPGERGYRFGNALFQQALYADLAPELRAEIHLRLARHLEAGPVNRAAERVGVHWEGAGEPERARPHLLEAARQAALRQEFLRAIDLGRRAGIVPGSPAIAADLDRSETFFRLASCYHAVGRPDDARRILEAVAAAAGARGLEELRLRAAVRLARVNYATRGASAVDLEEVGRAADRLPRCVELGRARYLLGLIAKYRDDLDGAESRIRSADEVYEALGLDSQHATALDQLGSIAMRRGRLEEAEALYGDAARIAASAGQRVNAAVGSVNRALASLRQGNVEGIAGTLEGSIRELSFEGARHWAAHATVILATARLAAGDRPGAEAAANEAVAALEGTSFLTGVGAAFLERARLRALKGDLEHARADLAAASVAAERSGDREVATMTVALEALVCCWAGDPAGAARAATSSVGLLREHDAPLFRADVALCLAEAGLYGLPPAPEVAAMADAPSLGSVSWAPRLRAAVRGLAALRDPGGAPRDIEEASIALVGPPFGERSAELRALAALCRAEALRRSGDAGASEAAREARDRARVVGNVWLEGLVARMS